MHVPVSQPIEKRSTLEQAKFGMTKTQQAKWDESCEKATKALDWMEENQVVMTMQEVSAKAGLHKNWIRNYPHWRRRYESILKEIRLKKSAEVKAKYATEEGIIFNPSFPRIDVSPNRFSVQGTAPRFEKLAKENWEKFIAILNQQLKDGIVDPAEWTRESIARKIGVSNNYFAKTHPERRKALEEAKLLAGVE